MPKIPLKGQGLIPGVGVSSTHKPTAAIMDEILAALKGFQNPVSLPSQTMTPPPPGIGRAASAFPFKEPQMQIPLEALLQRLGGQSALQGLGPQGLSNFDNMIAMGRFPGLRGIATPEAMRPPIGPPQPVMTPPTPEFKSPFSAPEGLQGELFNPTEVITPPVEQIRGLSERVKTPRKERAEAPSKAQLKALVERLLNRKIGPNEELLGDERSKAMQVIMEQGTPSSTLGMTNLKDIGRTPVTGAPMPTTPLPEGRALRLPVEDARVLALQNPQRFEPGGMTNFMFNPMKETFKTPPGSPEDIVGGIGLRRVKYEPLWTAPMKQAQEFLGRAEKEAAGYAIPKPANLQIATAQGFKIYNQLLRKGTSLGRVWEDLYTKALDDKPHIVGTLNSKEYFVECYQKMSMNRGRWQKNFAKEFKFIGEMGEQMRKLIAPEAQLAERVKTPMPVPEEGEKISFAKNPAKDLTGVKGEAGLRELKRSEESKTFKKFLEKLIREFARSNKKLTPMEIKTRWEEYLNTFKTASKGLPPLALMGIGGAYDMGSE